MNLAPYIDHTNLKPEAAAEDIKKLCEEALRCGKRGSLRRRRFPAGSGVQRRQGI